MPFGSEGREKGIGLALSGGGFRASLFHAGSLLRLHELGVLGDVDRISAVSGGSITAGLLACNWTKLDFADPNAAAYRSYVLDPLRAFCRRRIDSTAIIKGFLPFTRASDVVQASYDKHLFFDRTLKQLPDKPRFVFNSTNLQTGRSFRFSKPYMGDYLIGLVKNPDVKLSTAVAASSAFPPLLSPVVLKNLPKFENVEGAIFNGRPEYCQTIFLTDGGAYDNMGLETVWNRYSTVLVSDAGAPFGFPDRVKTGWLPQVQAALDIATEQSRALRKRALISDFIAKPEAGAYWGIDTDIRDYPIEGALECDEQVVKGVATLRTRLDPFSEEEQGRLINWGYALCDAALRSRVTSVLKAGVDRKWPYPAYALGSIA